LLRDPFRSSSAGQASYLAAGEVRENTAHD
jgi:hypothetical protein